MNFNPTIKCKKDFNSIALKMLLFAIVCGALYWYASAQFNELANTKVVETKYINLK